MRTRKRNDADHRGISLGTILMIAVTILVVGAYMAILPRLLGRV